MRLPEDFFFVGDVHGRLRALNTLWSKLSSALAHDRFSTLNVVFLGDYIDKGFDSKGVIDFLCKLKERYRYQQHTFLCGNHEFGMCAFLNLPPFSKISLQMQNESANNTNQSIEGRRWVTERYYQSEPTFTSYGATFSDRESLLHSLPNTHRAFLSNLSWVYENSSNDIGNIIAVHAGLEMSDKKRIDHQLTNLRERCINSNYVIKPIYAREQVFQYPMSLRQPYLQNRVEGSEPRPRILVSGHHAVISLQRQRYVLDSKTEVVGLLVSNVKAHHMSSGSSGSGSLEYQDSCVKDRENKQRTKSVHVKLFTSKT